MVSAGCALCFSGGTGLSESIQLIIGGGVRAVADAPRLGEMLDKKTAATIVAAADIMMDASPFPRRFLFTVALRGVFALPVISG